MPLEMLTRRRPQSSREHAFGVRQVAVLLSTTYRTTMPRCRSCATVVWNGLAARVPILLRALTPGGQSHICQCSAGRAVHTAQDNTVSVQLSHPRREERCAGRRQVN